MVKFDKSCRLHVTVLGFAKDIILLDDDDKEALEDALNTESKWVQVGNLTINTQYILSIDERDR